MKKNKRKLLVLHTLLKKPMSPDEVARELNITKTNASRLLLHYYRQRILERKTIDKMTGKKVYFLTEKGKKRLEYLFRKLKI